MDIYALFTGSRQVFTDEIGTDGKLSVTSVNQNRQLDRTWSPKVVECI
jgi:hypothetical protein